MSIDDVKLVNCSLAADRGGQCSSTETACSNGACIFGNQVGSSTNARNLSYQNVNYFSPYQV